MLRSMSSSRGARKVPSAARASIAPLPDRVGMSDTTEAPQEKATSIDRSSQSSCWTAGTNGGEMSRKARSDAPRLRSCSPRARIVDRHSLVQAIEGLGVHGLQAHRDFELNGRRAHGAVTIQCFEKQIDTRADECRMRFDDDTLEARECGRPRRHSRLRGRREDRRSCPRCRA